MLHKRSAELVPRRQGIGQLVHEGGGPHPGRLSVGAPALPIVHAGGGGGDAPFDDRQLARLDSGMRLLQMHLGVRRVAALQCDLRKQPRGFRARPRLVGSSGQCLYCFGLVASAVEVATRQPDLR